MRLLTAQRTLELREHGPGPSTEEPRERRLGVYLDGQLKGEFLLFRSYEPAVAINLPIIFLWGAERLYLLDSDTGEFRECLKHSDEVNAVYPIDSQWCIVGETSISVFDRSFSITVQHLPIDEIILESWWESERLHLKDLQGSLHVFEVMKGGGALKRVR
jgi:hypothetical protein